LNALSGSALYVADKLFATLDTTTRRVILPDERAVVCSDTVGFIQKLPHQLVAAFRGTLEEVIYADLLVHVVDLAHPQAAQQIQIVDTFLKSLLPEPGPEVVMALNKTDLVEMTDPSVISLLERYPNAIPISAGSGFGIEQLLDRVQLATSSDVRRIVIRVPFDHYDLVSRFYHVAAGVTQSNYDEGVELCGNVRSAELDHFDPFVVG
jgi:GTP-binding protein HflX